MASFTTFNDINKLRSDFNRFKRMDIQRNYAFRITFPYIPFENNETLKDVSVKCSKITIPGKEKKTKQFRFMGIQVTQSMGNVNANEFPITFILDSDLEMYNVLLRWYNSTDLLAVPIFNPSKTVDMRVDFLSMDCKTVKKTIYINGVFPSFIPDISLDQFSEGEIMFLECRFGFDDVNFNEYDKIIKPIEV